jgi:hypothetical protein
VATVSEAFGIRTNVDVRAVGGVGAGAVSVDPGPTREVLNRELDSTEIVLVGSPTAAGVLLTVSMATRQRDL